MSKPPRTRTALVGLFAVVGSIPLTAAPAVAGPPGDNGPIIYTADDGLRRVGPDGTGSVLIAPGTFSVPDVSGDGTTVLVVQRSEMDFTGPVVAIDIATGAMDTVVEDGATTAVWSPDGSSIAYATQDDGLFVIEEGTTRPVRAGVTAVFDWSPTDDVVLASRNVTPEMGFPEVYLEEVDVSTGSATTVADNGPGLYTWYPISGDYSPDGERIVYSYGEPGNLGVVFADAQGDPIDGRTATSQPTGPVTWSPDGTTVAYVRGTTTGIDLVFHTVASGAETSVSLEAGDLDWAPVPSTPEPTDGFEDVAADNVFAEDIAWLASEGITRGCNPPENTQFCPDDNVTRGQMAAFLVRAFGYTDGEGADLFTDDDGIVFETDIDRLATAGVTRGCNPPTNDNYCPDDFVTRGQMAAFLHRAIGD